MTMGTHSPVNSSKAKQMDKVSMFQSQASPTMEIEGIACQKARGTRHIQKVIFIKGNSVKDSSMGMAFFRSRMVISIKEALRAIRWMGKGVLCGVMVGSMRESGRTIQFMVTEFSLGRTVENTKVIIKIKRSMAKESLLGQTIQVMKVNG